MGEGLTTQKMFVHLPKLRKFYANFTQITQILRKLRKFYANYANLRKFFLRSYTQILSGQPLGDGPIKSIGSRCSAKLLTKLSIVGVKRIWEWFHAIISFQLKSLVLTSSDGIDVQKQRKLLALLLTIS